jgi:hypothetical protein
VISEQIAARPSREFTAVVEAVFQDSFAEEFDYMTTTYEVQYPDNMARFSHNETANWTESTIQSVVGCIEDYAREKPIPFALWAFGIGFALGWKLKPW